MKAKLLLSTILCVITASVITAQNKYKSDEGIVVAKTYDGTVFTSEKTFIENIAGVGDFTYLNAILEDESLVDMLGEDEMITVFAPKNATFNSLEEKTRDSILSNPTLVRGIMKRHVIPGRVDSNSILKGIAKNDGVIQYTTLAQERISFALNKSGQIIMFDSDKNSAVITSEDYMHKNGFFHVVDGLIYPAANH
jgi:uncharacterized surface protein with fasciclin (FAS1) repeats